MRLLELTVRNFRGFGPAVDPIDLDADLVLLFGPNGHGKTSLAEAIEWLFYGTTKRRLRGEDYSKSEYANTFANVHGGAPTEVTVRACVGGREALLSRVLGPRETSTTFVDGIAANFSSLGIQALDAFYPVVAQHGLQTFVHAKPKDRRDAICAALGLEELTALKGALDSARSSFQRTPPKTVIDARIHLKALAADLHTVPSASAVSERWSSTPAVVDQVQDEQALLKAASVLTGQFAPTSAEALARLRETRQTAGKAVFDTGPIALGEAHGANREAAFAALSTLGQASRAVDDAVATLAGETAAAYSAAILAFWTEGLALAGEGDACPMCEDDTLPAARKAELKARLEDSAATVAAGARLTERLRDWQGLFKPAVAAVAGLGIRGLDAEGRGHLVRLLGPDVAVPPFLQAHESFLLAQRALGEALQADRDANVATPELSAKPETLPTLIEQRAEARDGLASAIAEFTAKLDLYEVAWAAIAGSVAAKIAADDAVGRIDAVGKSLRALPEVALLARYAAVLDEAQDLIRSVEQTAQGKQEELLKSRGQEVADLYRLLNQGAAVGFEAMEPANDALKLHATSFGKRMPAAANLSECQLNCLGLAVWLMRATTPTSPFGFVVLDDPVQAMDDDHAEAFIVNIVPHLLDVHGKQVVVLSHVRTVTDRLRAINLHRPIRQYHYENFHQDGPVIVHQARLQQMLASIAGAAAGNDDNRQYAVDQLRVLIEAVVRELHLKQTGVAAPAKFDAANSGELLTLFQSIPGTQQSEHVGLKDTVRFCDPAHHTQVGYSVPLHSNIQPHIDRVKGLMKKYGLL